MNQKMLTSLKRLEASLAEAPPSQAIQDLRALCREVHRANQQEQEVRDLLGIWLQLWEDNRLSLTGKTAKWNDSHMQRLLETSRLAVPTVKPSKPLISLAE